MHHFKPIAVHEPLWLSNLEKILENDNVKIKWKILHNTNMPVKPENFLNCNLERLAIAEAGTKLSVQGMT